MSAGVRQAAEAGYGRWKHECAYGGERSLELESMAGYTNIGESRYHSSARALENLYMVCVRLRPKRQAQSAGLEDAMSR